MANSTIRQGLYRSTDTATVGNDYGGYSVTGTYNDVVSVVAHSQNYFFTVRGGNKMGKCYDTNTNNIVVAAKNTQVPVYVFYRS